MSIATLTRRCLFAVFVLAFCTAVMAQDAPSRSGKIAPTQTDSADQSTNDDQKNKDASGTSEFSEAVANNVVGDIRDGLEGHSQRLMLSAFDADKMNGYLGFADQIHAFFERYESFRVHARILHASEEQARGVVLAEFEVEGMPRGGGPALRRAAQLRFELERGKKGWKVVDFRPRGFFS